MLGPRRSRSPEEVVRRLLAVQAQDERAAALSLRARASGFSAADVAASRDLVVGWLMRGTLHLVAVEDWWWLWSLTARSVERSSEVDLVVATLADSGPLVRPRLLERLASRGLVLEGQAFPHLLADCCAVGEVVLTPAREFVLARDWVGERVAVDRDAALRELGLRYAAAHAEAEVDDLATWSGLGKRAARSALTEVEPAGRGAVGPRLLPAFDPYLLGWKDRSFAVPPELHKRAFPGGGMLRAVTVDEGRVTGTWTIPGGVLKLDTPNPDAYATEARDVQRFLGT
jgi:hypothetical protein